MFRSHIDELPRPRLDTPGFLLEIISTVVFVVAVTVLFDLAIPRSLVDGHSMEPTFYESDRLVVSRVHYLLGQPGRGDIVVFNSLVPSEAERGIMLIKRIVGLRAKRWRSASNGCISTANPWTNLISRKPAASSAAATNPGPWERISTLSWATTATTAATRGDSTLCRCKRSWAR